MCSAVENESVKNGLKPSEFYLLGYNSLQVLGWGYIGFLGMSHLLVPDPNENLFEKVILTLAIFQTLALLEVFHSIIGLVRSPISATAFQVASRVFIVWGVVLPSTNAQVCLGFVMVLIAWTITEIIRYSFYCTTILNITPYFLTFLRYTLFIVLYPLGVTGELLCIYKLSMSANDCSVYDYLLPNKLNLHFNYYYSLYFAILSYIFVFPQMYQHMKVQRRRVLGTSGTTHAKSQ